MTRRGDIATIPDTALEALKAVAFFVAWPGLIGTSAFVLWRAFAFQRQVKDDPVGRLVLLMVVSSVMTWAALAALATAGLDVGAQAPAFVLPLFLLWAGSMVLSTWIMHRWGAEAVRLNLYHTELARMDHMKTQLINTVAHEINTPLTPIRFRVSTLKAGGFGPVNAKQVEALSSIDRNLDRVDTLVGKMTLAVQLQTGKVQVFPRAVPLADVVAKVAERYMQAAADKGVTLLREERAHPTVQGDAGRLGVAVDGIVSNAVKFTPAGGTIWVRTLQRETEAVVEVEDTGLGLTPEAQVALFQPLRQTHEEMVTDAGAGLGLYISQAILRLHDGRVTVESGGLGKGSTFRIHIPLMPPPAAAA